MSLTKSLPKKTKVSTSSILYPSLKRKSTRLVNPSVERKLSAFISKISDEIETIKLKKKQKEQLNDLNDEMEKYGIPKRFDLVDLGKDIGEGIFLKKEATTIKKGDLIGVYTGRYIFYTPDKSELDFRYLFGVHGPVELSKEELLYHFPDNRDPHSGLKITKKDEIHIGCDAIKMGNFTRLINQGDEKHVNCEGECVLIGEGKGKKTVLICIFASKSIQPGHQLLLDYGEEYWAELGVDPFKLKNIRRKKKV